LVPVKTTLRLERGYVHIGKYGGTTTLSIKKFSIMAFSMMPLHNGIQIVINKM
jgi:hypothetical protein